MTVSFDTEMPALFRARLAAALSRPVLLDPRALDSVRAAAFTPKAETRSAPYVRDGNVAVVSIEGPLAQRAWSCWVFEGDGYDAIQARVFAALEDRTVSAVVLRIDSPGGEVAGCTEAVRAIQAAKKTAGKPIVAYADEMACSAAYELACACDEIVVPDSGYAGSIGVIATLLDESKALELEGVAVNLVTSGARKADGHSAQPLSAEARAAIQAEVDHLAGIFFNVVAESRNIAVADVRALEAGVFLGADAVAKGLADHVGNLRFAIDRAAELATTNEARASANAFATGRKTEMEAKVKSELGLPEDADEETIVAKIRTLITQSSKLAVLEQERAAAEKREREALIARGRAEGKIDKTYLEAVVPTMSLEALRAHVEHAKSQVPLGAPHREPEGNASTGTTTAEGNTWADLSAQQKHDLRQRDPNLAAQLKREHDTARKTA